MNQGYTTYFSPRFSETDGLGHINNTVIPVWFESARDPIFKIFVPSLEIAHWNLILAKISVDFKAPTFYGSEVKVITSVSRIGNSSFEVHQKCYQNDELTAEGRTQMVHFDYETNRSQPISKEIRAQLEQLAD
ncbi:acyl-CoA thioesterase [Parashewanella tropica]|uniref:acyl-CoA thioesterase n=1 Tax=Parashewanella tropica TaxID=2547970 RepID=UPI0010595675|nr:thioesterase family protein [Parashewanella tropica]